MEYRALHAMGTDFLLASEGSEKRARAAFDEVEAFIVDSESRLSRFRESSELCALNRAAGRWSQVSPELFDLLRLASQYHSLTGGLFNPAVLDALERSGYDRSLDEVRGHEVAPAVGEASPVAEFAQLRLDAATCAVFLPVGMRLDLGGLAKGWAAQRGAEILAKAGAACAVNAGGDMFLVGLPSGQSAWQVGLEDPRDPELNLAVLSVGPGAVATSSITKRRWLQGRTQRHHIIDPRTGEPAAATWLSVTVIHPEATAAEALAKALLIAGPRGVDALAEKNGTLSYVAVDKDGRLWGSEHSQEYIDVRNEIIAG